MPVRLLTAWRRCHSAVHAGAGAGVGGCEHPGRCVSPGIIRTRFQDNLTSEQVENNTRNRIPLHREGRPEEVAAALAALVENDFITGADIPVDGGITIRMV